MATVDLKTNQDWNVRYYNTACATCNVDIMRPLVFTRETIRWTYTLLVQVYPDSVGVDGKGGRASGWSSPAIISDPPVKNILHTLVGIGDTVLTPFGNYRVEWENKFNKIDRYNLSLVEIVE